jgi:hypothetical protein
MAPPVVVSGASGSGQTRPEAPDRTRSRVLPRLLAGALLVGAGGLALPAGLAQAAACSGTAGVTVVIDYGSSSMTLCGADKSRAIDVLTAVASVTYPPQYRGTVVCQINNVPSQQCSRMPPASAYWAFFHAARGGSWVYSSSGVADYDPAPGTVIGFAFGSGGAPSSAPPAPAPAPNPNPSPSSTSSTPRATTPKATTNKPRTTGTSPTRPTGGSAGTGKKGTRSAATASGSTAATRPGSATTTTTAPPSTTTTAPSGVVTTPTGGQLSAGQQPAHATTGTGSPTTLLAGLGLVGLVGAAAAYLALRRRAHG